MGWAYAMPAGVESGSGPKQPDGPGRTRESIPSCIPTISSPGCIFMGSRKSGYCSTANSIVDGWQNQELVKTIELYDEFSSKINRNHFLF